MENLSTTNDEETAVPIGWGAINLIYDTWVNDHAYFRAIARRVVEDYDEVEEVLQSAFERAWRALARLPYFQIEQLCLRPWLSQIVFNRAIDEKKRRQRLIYCDLLEEDNWLSRFKASAYDDPENVVIYAEDKVDLDSLLAKLPSAYQNIIVQIVLCQWSYKKIAAFSASTIETLRTRYHRAVRALAKIVKNEGIREEELRRWLLVYHFNLDEERTWMIMDEDPFPTEEAREAYRERANDL